MSNKGWLSRHRLLTATLIAASVYFLLAPLSDTLHHDFSRSSFLVMHSLMEAISIIIAFMCFGIVFHSYRLSRNDRNLFLGVTFLAVGLIDSMHALSYAGMPAFVTENTVNKATQLWVSGRVVAAAGFIMAAFIGKENGSRFSGPYPLALIAVLTAMSVFIGVILYPDWFPTMFIPGKGLTPAKIMIEYGVVGVMAASGAMFYHSYRKTHEEHLPYFVAAMAVLIFSELFFTVYAHPYDIYNFMGHVYKTAGYFLIYKMIFITSIRDPHVELSNAKEVLRNYADGLEDTVRERTAELKSRNEELERLVALKTEFLAMCSHDMKTPIQSTLLLLELLLEEVDGPLGYEQKEDLLAIKKNQDGLQELIVNLLDLARKEQGSLVLEPETVNLDEVLDDFRSAHAGVAARRGVEFSLEKPDVEGGCLCALDVPKFRQVINNLVSNALKFTPSGGRIEVTVADDGSGSLLFRVFNSGEALPEDKLDTIFERYSQVPSLAKDTGVGLGLCIARNMVELHGGKIWVQSIEGEGNEFCFTIPKTDNRHMRPSMESFPDAMDGDIREHSNTEV